MKLECPIITSIILRDQGGIDIKARYSSNVYLRIGNKEINEIGLLSSRYPHKKNIISDMCTKQYSPTDTDKEIEEEDLRIKERRSGTTYSRIKK